MLEQNRDRQVAGYQRQSGCDVVEINGSMEVLVDDAAAPYDEEDGEGFGWWSVTRVPRRERQHEPEQGIEVEPFHLVSSTSTICYRMDSLTTNHDSAMFDLSSKVIVGFCAAGEVDGGRHKDLLQDCAVLDHILAKTTCRRVFR